MIKPKLYMLIGIPGSGKSTFCKKYLSHLPIESRDEHRLKFLKPEDKFFDVEHDAYQSYVSAIANHLKNKQDCVADATHLNFKSRNQLIHRLYREGLSLKDYNIIMIYFDIPLGICLERNALRTGRAFVPEKTIIEMKGRLRKPDNNEFSNSINLTIVGVGENDEQEQGIYHQ